MSLRPILVAVAALATGGAMPAAAAAAGTATDTAYAVKFTGQGTYRHVDHQDQADGFDERATDLRFSFSGAITDGVVFRNGSLYDKTGDDLPQVSATGTHVIVHRSGDGGTREECPAQPVADQQSRGLMRFAGALGDLAALDGQEHLYLRPFEDWGVLFDCPGDSHPGVELVDRTDASGTNLADLAPGSHTFDQVFELPRDIIGMGLIEQRIPAKAVTGEQCPGYVKDLTTECRLEWSATITLRKVWQRRVPAGSPPPSADDDFLVPLVPRKRVKLQRREASAEVTCAAACAGEIELVPLVRPRAAKVKPLASARFSLPPGATKRVRVRLGSKARRALRRSGRATLRISFTRPARTARSFTVRAPAR